MERKVLSSHWKIKMKILLLTPFKLLRNISNILFLDVNPLGVHKKSIWTNLQISVAGFQLSLTFLEDTGHYRVNILFGFFTPFFSCYRKLYPMVLLCYSDIMSTGQWKSTNVLHSNLLKEEHEHIISQLTPKMKWRGLYLRNMWNGTYP